MFSELDRREILKTCGIEVVTESGQSLYVIEPQWADAQMKYTGGGDIDQELPMAKADHDDIRRLGIVGGEDGTVLIFGADLYRVLSVEPERNGFCFLQLGKP